ncbi:MAG TPA: TerC family protein [Phycisphaerales bacterium]|nr:TerC family protein [Phycisphaerales bacterium]
MIWVWVGFVTLVLALLALDLLVLNRKAHEVTMREAAKWTTLFVLVGAGFAGAVYTIYSRDVGGLGTRYLERYAKAPPRAEPAVPIETGRTPPPAPDAASAPEAREAPIVLTPETISLGAKSATLEYLTGWIVEYSLSMDNIFVIALIFGHFRVPAKHQHRVLFWGIMGALILRGVMIGAGAILVERFGWILYLFAAFLIYAGLKIIFTKDDESFDPEKSPVYRLARRAFPFTTRYDEQRFFTMEEGKRVATPLLLVLLLVESTDVVFAVDSIPAIFSITKDPFLVFSSNAFAIMGLRSLYFLLAGAMHKFELLKYSLSFILIFVGFKMLAEHWFHTPAWLSLSIVVLALAVGLVGSLVQSRGKPPPPPPETPTGAS